MLRYAGWLALASLGGAAGCSRHADPTPTAAKPAIADTGARLFNGNCIACHQEGARGRPGVYPSLVSSPVLLGEPKDLARWGVRGQRPVSMPAGRYPTLMPAFGWMKPGDVAALLTYLRSHFGNEASAVDAATVTEALDE